MTITEYRDKTILALMDKYPEAIFGWSDGFDAALELDLAIKFAEWKEYTVTYYAGLFRDANNKNEPLKQLNGDLAHTNKQLFDYWIENVFKIEI